MMKRSAIAAIMLLAGSPTFAQSTRIPPNAIDRATAASDARRSSIDTAARADRDRATRDARDTAARIGPLPQSTIVDRVGGVSGTLTPPPAASPPPATPD